MSAVEQQQPEQQRVSGVVQGIITKNADTWQITVLPEGSQYAKNLWTKDGALVNDMTQRIGQAFDFLCNVSHWTRNDGQSVRSLWVNSVGGYGSVQEPQQPAYAQPQAQQAQTPVNTGQPATAQQAQPQQHPQAQPAIAPQLPQEVKELRIMRQTAMKVAAQLLPYLPPEQRNLSGLQIVAEWQVRYYTGGPQDQPWQEGPNGQAQSYSPQPQPQTQGGGFDSPGDPGPQEGQYETQGGPTGFPPGY